MEELYTCDYVLSTLERELLNVEIERLTECKKTLQELVENTESIERVCELIDNSINERESQLNKKYSDGVYKLRRNIGGVAKDTFIKREKGDSCDNCIFNKIPCLGPKYEYGCYRADKNSSNANPLYGRLVGEGHFVEYNLKSN